MMDQLQVGEHLDRYVIEDVVAKGGMACIYRARDLGTGSTVVIKIPRFEAESDPLLFDRFKREEEIGRKLNHPGIMKVSKQTTPAGSTWSWNGSTVNS
jgi:eukaryotic-like serine/threonine-protein kinase